MLSKEQIDLIFDNIGLSCIVFLNKRNGIPKEPDRFIADIKEYIKEYERGRGR